MINTNSKPTILALQEAEQALVGTVNDILKSGVPCFFLELIIDKIHHQITNGAKQELAQASAQFESQRNTTSPDTENPDGKEGANDGY